MKCELCPADAARLYPAGWRCDACQPARVAGREPPPTPNTPIVLLSDIEHERLVDVAIAQLERNQADKARRARRRTR